MLYAPEPGPGVGGPAANTCERRTKEKNRRSGEKQKKWEEMGRNGRNGKKWEETRIKGEETGHSFVRNRF